MSVHVQLRHANVHLLTSLYVFRANTRAIRMYEKLGFEVLAELPRYYAEYARTHITPT